MPRRHRRLVPGLLLALSLAAGGCGGSSDAGSAEKEPSKATTACRERWSDLADDVNGREKKTNPSALAQRWSSIAATISHYATAGTESDCDGTLTDVEQAMTDLTGFGGKLAAYDMELRLQQVKAGAEEYAASPRPDTPAPSAAPKTKGKKAKKPRPAPLPPKPAAVAKALGTLTRQAPLATKQQEAGWQQARAVELSDAKAVAKAERDLEFLSTQSPAYRASTAALTRIRAALKASGS